MTVGDLALESLVGAGTVIAAIVAARAAHSLGLPALLVFLGLGLALGEGAGIRVSDPGPAEVFGLGALAVTLLSSAGGHHPVAWVVIGQVAWQLIGGLAIGLAVGFIGAFLVRRAALPASGLYPVAVIALVVVGYGAASLVAASGFLAVYVSAVVL